MRDEYGQRLQMRSALEAIQRDPRPPILLLRAFADDSLLLPGCTAKAWWLPFTSHRQGTFEEFLSELLAACGPVIACGQPGKQISPLGAKRFWVSHERWQAVVKDLLREAKYVVMILGDLRIVHDGSEADLDRNIWAESGAPQAYPARSEDGLTWEARQFFALPDLQKAVLIMPPVDEARAAARWRQYHAVSRGLLPPYRGGELVATFDADGTCRVVRVGRRDMAAYQAAIRVQHS